MRWKLVMWKCSSRFRVLLLIAGLCVAGTACRRDMQDQPKMKPYRGTTFFNDGLSARQPIAGTVPRGFLRTDTEFYTGKKSASYASPQSTAENPFADDVDAFPFPITD